LWHQIPIFSSVNGYMIHLKANWKIALEIKMCNILRIFPLFLQPSRRLATFTYLSQFIGSRRRRSSHCDLQEAVHAETEIRRGRWWGWWRRRSWIPLKIFYFHEIFTNIFFRQMDKRWSLLFSRNFLNVKRAHFQVLNLKNLRISLCTK